MESSAGSVPALSCHRRATDSGVSEAAPENWRPGPESRESKVFLRQSYITWCNKRLENSDAITKAPAEWVTPDLMNPAGRQEFGSSAPGFHADVWGKHWRFTLARKCWMLLLISNSCQGWNASQNSKSPKFPIQLKRCYEICLTLNVCVNTFAPKLWRSS